MTRTSRIRTVFVGGALAAVTALGGMTAVAQDASPEASPVAGVEPEIRLTAVDPDGTPIGYGNLGTNDDGTVTVTLANSGDSGLEPGEHGIHVHETGACSTSDDEAFSDAGDHFDPTGEVHGGLDSDERHAGDLGNLTVNDDGSYLFTATTDAFTLDAGAENSLNDADGAALVIHADADDLTTDPDGASGERLGCGVIFPDTTGGGATPVSSPVATPVS